MYEAKYNFQCQEQVAYSNISQFLNSQSYFSNYPQLSNQFDTNKVSNKKQLIDKEKGQGQDNRNYHQSSQSSKEDQSQESQPIQNRSKAKRRFKNKQSKNKFYARNYREKRKEKFKYLQQENQFLKSKIDELNFRLKQAQIELNKLKHNNNQSLLQSTRESLIKQINELLTKQNSQIDKLVELQQELKKLNSFESKHKMDLLNYFMSQLLENLINDNGFYFTDSLLSQKGLWSLNSKQPCRQIDYEICEILGLQNFQGIKTAITSISKFSLAHLKNFKNLWKKLYLDYLNIVNQGILIESFCKPLLKRKDMENLPGRVKSSLKLELYFQKIKYRKDMRQLRHSWFQQMNFQADNNKQLMNKIENLKQC